MTRGNKEQDGNQEKCFAMKMGKERFFVQKTRIVFQSFLGDPSLAAMAVDLRTHEAAMRVACKEVDGDKNESFLLPFL